MLRYPEFRRAVRVLWVWAAVVLVMVVLRLALHGSRSQSYCAFDAWVLQVKAQSGSVASVRHNVNGSTTETITNEHRRIRIVNTQGGYGGRIIYVTIPARESASVGKLLRIPGTAVYYDTEDRTSHVSNYNTNVLRVRDMVNVGMVVGLIFATLLGGALGKENDGHLSIVWLRPVSRTHYALVTMSISVAVVLAAELLTSAILLGAGMLTIGNGRDPDWTYAWAIPSAMLIPVAWYALLTASSASLRRGPAVVVGVAWACAFALLGASHASDAPAVLASIVGAINWVNPLHYVDSNAADAVRYAVALAALTIAYCAAAVFQWRRAEL